jgi:hypothetical protein
MNEMTKHKLRMTKNGRSQDAKDRDALLRCLKLTVVYKAKPGQMCRVLGSCMLKLNPSFPPIGARANDVILPVGSRKIRTEENKENEGL